MIEEIEDWFVLRDGTRLFEKTWKPAASPKAHLIFLHGFNDHSEIQYYLFPTLASHPYSITCHAVDQRGWGKSVLHHSQRGLTGPTNQVLSDIDEYVQHVSTNKIGDLDATPLFIMGHSMGAQQVLHYLLSTSSSLPSVSKLAGAIVEAPYVALDPKSEPSTVLVMAGKLAAMITPKTQMKQHLDSRYISRDPTVNRAWKEDPLCHDYGTFEGLRDMLKRGVDLLALSSGLPGSPRGLKLQLPVPIYWTHGTMDRITAFDPSKALFDRLLPPVNPSARDNSLLKTFKAYEGAYHKIHAEPDGVGPSFAQDVAQWIVRVVAARQGIDHSSGNTVRSEANAYLPRDDPKLLKIPIKANL